MLISRAQSWWCCYRHATMLSAADATYARLTAPPLMLLKLRDVSIRLWLAYKARHGWYHTYYAYARCYAYCCAPARRCCWFDDAAAADGADAGARCCRRYIDSACRHCCLPRHIIITLFDDISRDFDAFRHASAAAAIIAAAISIDYWLITIFDTCHARERYSAMRARYDIISRYYYFILLLMLITLIARALLLRWWYAMPLLLLLIWLLWYAASAAILCCWRLTFIITLLLHVTRTLLMLIIMPLLLMLQDIITDAWYWCAITLPLPSLFISITLSSYVFASASALRQQSVILFRYATLIITLILMLQRARDMLLSAIRYIDGALRWLFHYFRAIRHEATLAAIRYVIMITREWCALIAFLSMPLMPRAPAAIARALQAMLLRMIIRHYAAAWCHIAAACKMPRYFHIDDIIVIITRSARRDYLRQTLLILRYAAAADYWCRYYFRRYFHYVIFAIILRH